MPARRPASTAARFVPAIARSRLRRAAFFLCAWAAAAAAAAAGQRAG